MADDTNEVVEESAPKRGKKKGKGLVIALVLILPILIGGGALAAAKMGVIKIPGLTPAKAVAKAADAYGDKDSKIDLEVQTPTEEEVTEEEPPKKMEAVKPPEPKTDPEIGAKKLAGIWNNMEPSQIVTIAATYKDEEFAFVLSKMEPEIVAEVLAAMPDPKRAAKLSQQIQNIASVIPEPQT